MDLPLNKLQWFICYNPPPAQIKRSSSTLYFLEVGPRLVASSSMPITLFKFTGYILFLLTTYIYLAFALYTRIGTKFNSELYLLTPYIL